MIKIKEIWNAIVGRVSFGKYIKVLLTIVVNLAIAVVVGSVLLMGVYRLPIDKIDANMKASAEIMRNEGNYPSLSTWFHSQLDNYTDTIMLTEAADNTEASLWSKAMFTYRGTVDGYDGPTEALAAHYIDGVAYTNTAQYPRYWHGYLVFLRPLLTVLNYGGIRVLNGIVQLALIAFACVLMYRRKMKLYIIPYILSYLMLMPLALAKSLQFSSCFYIFVVGAIVLLLMKENMRKKYLYLVFLNLGIATAFFDFLTYPIATFGVPAALCIVLGMSDSLEEKLGGIVKNGISWCLGYGGMWVSKWIIASITTDTNVIQNAFDAVNVRTSNVGGEGADNISVLSCEVTNYFHFIKTPVTLLAIAFVAYIVIRCIRKNNLDAQSAASTMFPYVLVAAAPVIWHAFASNHSMLHYWFTNKACVVTLIAILFGLANLKQQILHKQ